MGGGGAIGGDGAFDLMRNRIQILPETKDVDIVEGTGG